MQDVEFAAIPPDRFRRILDSSSARRFERALSEAAERCSDRTVWSINSTPKGGGVAEMLSSLLGYLAGAGIDVRWSVIEGDDDFFRITKRIHNRLHDSEGDGGPFDEDELARYERCLIGSARELRDRVRQRDIVILHDPQPIGLVPVLKDTGATVLWRCHIGVDHASPLVSETWNMLRPFIAGADAIVFSREAYVWSGLDRAEIIPPSIDAFSPKNQDLDPGTVAGILSQAGLFSDGREEAPRFERLDGTSASVTRKARMVEESPVPPGARIVTQVSRWDRLKDPTGVIRGFARHVPEDLDAHLILAGPGADGVADDPETDEVVREVEQARRDLPFEQRARVHLAFLPVRDEEENSAIVNALQRRSDVVVQKSLAEGFGLTVAEAMWKERPVVASGIGGIQDQISDGESGLLVGDPTDLDAFGRAVSELLADPVRAGDMGRAARQRVCRDYLATRHLLQFLDLVRRLVQSPRRSASAGTDP